MILAIHPRLAERAVFEAVRGDATVAAMFHRQFADCYKQRDAQARENAFESLHLRWFDDLGLRDRLTRLIAEFPHVRDRVARFVVAPAAGAKRQTAELFGTPGHLTVGVEVSPALLLDCPAFAYWARHELLHIDDMLDPAFGFDRRAVPLGATVAAKNLALDRFAVLWAISVDARLTARGQAADDVRQKRANEFDRVSCSQDRARSAAQFESIWAQFLAQRPTHASLLELTRSGIFDPETENPAEAAMPGAACPLCNFPTFDWATREELRSVANAVRADFENWIPSDGGCRRCWEVYRAQSGSRAAGVGSG